MTRDADIAAMMQPDPSKRSAPLRPRIIHTFDGELDFLNAAIDVFIDNPPPALANQGIELGKFPASSSKTNQPCDVAKSYLIMKGLANRNLGLSPAAFVIALPEILKDFDRASYKTYSNFLGQLPDYISRAFTSVIIKEGWKAAGLFPLDLGIIMGRCTTWRVMSASQGAAIMAAFPGLIELARQQGELSDQDLQNAVGESIDFDAWMLKHGLQSVRQNSVGPTTVLNHRRAVWINHHSITTGRKKRAADKLVAEEEKKQKRLATEEAKRKRAADKEAAQQRKATKATAPSKPAGHKAKKPRLEVAAAAVATQPAAVTSTQLAAVASPRKTTSGRTILWPQALAPGVFQH